MLDLATVSCILRRPPDLLYARLCALRPLVGSDGIEKADSIFVDRSTLMLLQQLNILLDGEQKEADSLLH